MKERGENIQSLNEDWEGKKEADSSKSLQTTVSVLMFFYLVLIFGILIILFDTMPKSTAAEESVVFYSIKTLSWAWFLARTEARTCFNFSSWCNYPLACLQSG